MISAKTQVAAVLGDPIAHSLSPVLHNAAYEALSLDYVYVAWRVDRAAAAAAFAGVGALGLVGVNVTMPLKDIAAASADRRSGEVSRLRAANTIVNESGSLVAHNTDVEGFVRGARDGLGRDLAGSRAVVVGAGGAARAVVVALAREGSERVIVLGRRKRPSELAAALAGALGRAVPISSRAAVAALRTSDLLVNATPLGMEGDGLPLPLVEAIESGHAVMDLVYAPPETPLLLAARAAGAKATGGLGMLVHQAGIAFTLFTGQPAPLEVMSAAAVAALSRGSGG